MLRGVGNANLPLLFVGIACVINILGDLLLVGVFHMDVAGAAIATVFAQFVSVVCSVVVLRKQDMPIEFSREQCRIYKEELGKILNVGVPLHFRRQRFRFHSCRKFCYQSDGSDAICPDMELHRKSFPLLCWFRPLSCRVYQHLLRRISVPERKAGHGRVFTLQSLPDVLLESLSLW